MKSQLTRSFRNWVLACVATLSMGHQAGAFPPAPNHVITGMIRDEWGDPLAVTNAIVILETSSLVRVTTLVVPNLSAGVNYRLSVPMDSGLTSDTYKPTALQPTVPFRMKVQIGGVTYVPIQMTGDYNYLGQPAQTTRLDLTLGLDSTGDGIPDAWKKMVLSMSGGIYTNISQIHAGDHYPGNKMTFMQAYIAGTYPWDPTDGFALTVVGTSAGAPLMELMAITGRSYSLQGSQDLKNWVPVRFLDTASGSQSTLLNFQATEVRILQLMVPLQSGGTNRFYKAMVQ